MDAPTGPGAGASSSDTGAAAVTPVTTADVAIAQNLNQALSTVSTALNTDSTAVVAILNAIASAISSSIIGGSTGNVDQAVLRSKGTSGLAIQNSIVGLDSGGNLTGVGNITENATGNNAAVPRVLVQSTAAGQVRFWQMETNGLSRWIVLTNNAPETGSNAGSDWGINRYDDTGAFIDTPVFIQRSTGVVTVNSLSASSVSTNTLTVGGGMNPWSIAPDVQIVTSSATITIPANATKCRITLVGGGGGGAGVFGA